MRARRATSTCARCRSRPATAPRRVTSGARSSGSAGSRRDAAGSTAPDPEDGEAARRRDGDRMTSTMGSLDPLILGTLAALLAVAGVLLFLLLRSARDRRRRHAELAATTAELTA